MVDPNTIDPELVDLAERIIRCIRKGNSIAWIGSGFSKEEGYPDWPNSLRHLCEACGIPPLALNETPSPDKLLDMAEECKAKNQSVYQQTLAHLYGRRPHTHRPALHHLMRLGFRGYITTNFDPLVRDVATTHEIDEFWTYPNLTQSPLGGNARPVYYIHGMARLGNEQTGENLVLARSDFDEAYGDNGRVKRFLEDVLAYYSVLFLGCQLKEPVMDAVFARVFEIHRQIEKTSRGRPRPERYILLPRPVRKVNESMLVQGSMEQIKEDVERDVRGELQEGEKRYSDMRIKVFHYDPTNPPGHRAIDLLIEHVCMLCDMPVEQLPRVSLVEEYPHD